MILVLNIATNDVSSNLISNTPDKVTVIPQFSSPKLFPGVGKLLEYLFCRYALHYLYQSGWRISRWRSQKHMHMVLNYFHGIYFKTILFTYPLKYFLQIARDITTQYILPVFWNPDQIIFQIVDGLFGSFYTHDIFISGTMTSMQPCLITRLTASHFHPASRAERVFSGLFL